MLKDFLSLPTFNFLASLINGNFVCSGLSMYPLSSFNFLASLINGNPSKHNSCCGGSQYSSFNFLASLINGNTSERQRAASEALLLTS